MASSLTAPASQDRRPGATRFRSMLVSERVGQLFFDSGSGPERLEYTEYGAGPHWVVLLHAQLMPRRMQQPLARALAALGLHVVTLDLLGHGRSDRRPPDRVGRLAPPRPGPAGPAARPARLLDDRLRRPGRRPARPPGGARGDHRRHLAGR